MILPSATKESVDIEDLVDDFVTFYIAGQETTASMFTFALVLTLLHPNVLERCFFFFFTSCAIQYEIVFNCPQIPDFSLR